MRGTDRDEGVEVRDTLPLGVAPEGIGDWEGDGVGVGLRLLEELALGTLDLLGVPDGEAPTVREAVGVPEGVRVLLAVMEQVPLLLGEPVPVLESDKPEDREEMRVGVG